MPRRGHRGHRGHRAHHHHHARTHHRGGIHHGGIHHGGFHHRSGIHHVGIHHGGFHHHRHRGGGRVHIGGGAGGATAPVGQACAILGTMFGFFLVFAGSVMLGVGSTGTITALVAVGAMMLVLGFLLCMCGWINCYKAKRAASDAEAVVTATAGAEGVISVEAIPGVDVPLDQQYPAPPQQPGANPIPVAQPYQPGGAAPPPPNAATAPYPPAGAAGPPYPGTAAGPYPGAPAGPYAGAPAGPYAGAPAGPHAGAAAGPYPAYPPAASAPVYPPGVAGTTDDTPGFSKASAAGAAPYPTEPTGPAGQPYTAPGTVADGPVDGDLPSYNDIVGQ